MSYQHPVFEVGRSGGAVKSGGGVRLCPSCGETLIGGRCPECTPAAPARSYVDGSMRTGLLGFGPEPRAVDVRRATSEWLKAETDHDPHTRKAHPTQVRTALAEAEELARERTLRESLTHGVSIDRPRRGRTPVPPAPTAATNSTSVNDEVPRTATDPWLAKAPATSTPPPEPGPTPRREFAPAARPALETDTAPAAHVEPPRALDSDPPPAAALSAPPVEAPRVAPASSARAEAPIAPEARPPSPTSTAPARRSARPWLAAGLALAGLAGLLAALL